MRRVIARNKRWSLPAAWLLAVTALCAQTPPPAHAPEKLIPPSQRVSAPDFTLPDVQGKQITLSKYQGRVVLLDFWATTCGGCKVELPWYVAFESSYAHQGLSLIGLDMYGESPEIVRPFMAKWNMHYPVAIGTDALGDRFGLKEMPLTLLIDRKGRIALSHAGIVDRAVFEDNLRRLLRE